MYNGRMATTTHTTTDPAEIARGEIGEDELTAATITMQKARYERACAATDAGTGTQEAEDRALELLHRFIRMRDDADMEAADPKALMRSGTAISHAVARSERTGRTMLVRASGNFFHSFAAELVAFGGECGADRTVRGNRLYHGDGWAIELAASS